MPLLPCSLGQVLTTVAVAMLLAAPAPALAKKGEQTSEPQRQSATKKKVKRKNPTQTAAALRDGDAERRLLEISQLTAQGRAREALPLAERLVRDHPNFQLAQLALGDLLAARARPLGRVGDVVPAPAVAMAAPPPVAGL